MAGAVLLALVALCVPAGAARADAGFGERLARADALRSADPGRFEALLASLEAEAGKATAAQRDRLDYLRAYRLAVYGNRPAEAAEKALALLLRAGDVDMKFRAGALAASSHATTRDFAEGLRVLDRIMPMRHDVRDRGVRHAGLYAAAMLYHELGQYQLALRYADEILDDRPAERERCMASSLQLHARYRLAMLPADNGPLRRSIDLCLAAGEEMTANFIRVVLARKLAADGRGEDALELFRLHMPAIEAIGYQRLTVEAHSLMAELQLAAGELAEAERHARASIASAKSFSTGLPLVTAYRVLAEAAERRGDPVAALAAYRRYSNADIAYLGDLRARELAYDIVRDETTARARQIELLDQRNQLLRLQQEAVAQAERRYRWVLAGLVTLILALGAWTWRMSRREPAPGEA